MLKLPKGLPSPVGMDKAEILQVLLEQEYGFLPEAPKSVSWETVKTDTKFCAGYAQKQKVNLTCTMEHGTFTFPVYYTLPTRVSHPVPCVILINFRDAVPDDYLPSEEIVNQGYAVISFCYKDVTSDDGDFTNGLAGVVYPYGKRAANQCGKIGLWAWAAMRVMDFAQTLPELDSGKISVLGHSRLGKTALLTGALDERVYCAFSNDSGCSGAALSRNMRETGESIQQIYTRFPYWFCENFAKYLGAEDTLPFDQHYLLAANVPHRVYVASAQEDLWASPENEYLSCVAASEYYSASGLPGFVHPDRMPEIGENFHEGYIGYHIRSGVHYLSRHDWLRYIAFLNKSY